jgi:hypothetical protein
MAMMRLGFRRDEVLAMSEVEMEGWLTAAGLISRNKTYIVRRKRKRT